MTSGHMLNPQGAPDLCRFLLEIGYDGVTTPTGFSWGVAEALPFLPRVRAGRLVLRPAMRQPRGLALERLQPDDERRFAVALPAWRRRWRVPRHVHLAAGDNRLLLDLDDPAQAAQLRQRLRRGRGGDLVLEEALPGPGDAWLPGPGGRYAVEVVVPLVRRERVPASGAPATPGQGARVRVLGDGDRRRPPGSDWLFLSLYGPRAAEDELLAGPVREFAAGLVDTGQVDGWLFVRYADPEPHLRLRFHGAPSSLASAVLPSAAVWAAGLVAGGRRARFGVGVCGASWSATVVRRRPPWPRRCSVPTAPPRPSCCGGCAPRPAASTGPSWRCSASTTCSTRWGWTWRRGLAGVPARTGHRRAAPSTGSARSACAGCSPGPMAPSAGPTPAWSPPSASAAGRSRRSRPTWPRSPPPAS